jgi:hypothetical protein
VELSNSSGVRYLLVTTYSVIMSLSDDGRASPKSQIFRSQLAFSSKLLGFAVDHLRRVDVLEPAQDLVQEVQQKEEAPR